MRISVTMKIMVYLALPLMLTDWADCYVSAKLKCLSFVPRLVCQQAVRQICKNDFQKYMNVLK